MNTQLTEHKQHDDSDWKEKIVEDYYAEYYPNARTEKVIFKYLDDLYYVGDDDIFFTIYRKSDDWFINIEEINQEIEKLFGLGLPDEIKIGDSYIQPARNPIPNRVIKNWVKDSTEKQNINEHNETKLNPELMIGDEILVVADGHESYADRPELYMPYVVTSIKKPNKYQPSNAETYYGLEPIGMTDEYRLGAMLAGGGKRRETLLYPGDDWILEPGFLRGEYLTEHDLPQDKEVKYAIQGIVDRVYPQIVYNLGKSRYVNETPQVELHKDIYERVSGIEGMTGEESKSSEAEWVYEANKIYIYYPNMKDEKHVIQSLLHEYTHSLQDPKKRIKHRELGYQNDPDEIEALEAELNWREYLKDNEHIVETFDSYEEMDFNGDDFDKGQVITTKQDKDWTGTNQGEFDDENSTLPSGFDYVFGDSIANGLNGITKADGWQKPGANPTRVYNEIRKFTEDMDGKKVLLSSGYSNDYSQTSWINKQIDYLKELGATVYLLGVSNTYQKFLDKNNYPFSGDHNGILKNITKAKQVEFLGGFEAGKDNVHPPNGNYQPLYNSIINSSVALNEHKEPGLNPELERGDTILIVDIDRERENGETTYTTMPPELRPERFIPYIVIEKVFAGSKSEWPWKYTVVPEDKFEDYKEHPKPYQTHTNEQGEVVHYEKLLYPWIYQWIYANTPTATKVDRLTLTEHKETNNKLINKYISEFWPQYRSQLYSKLYNTYHPSTYTESFNRASGNFEDALETVADAVHDGKKLGLIDSSVDWSDIIQYDENEDSLSAKRLIDDDGIPTLNDKLEIMDNTNLDWIHGILLFDVLEEIVDEFKHYCGENGIDESGMGKCMDEFPPSPVEGTNKPENSGTLKQDYYTLFNFMRELERAGIPVTDYLKDPTYPNIIKLVDTGTSDYNEEGGERTSADWDNTRTQTEFEMDAPDRIDEQEEPETNDFSDEEIDKRKSYDSDDEEYIDDTPFTRKEVIILKALHKNLTREELRQLTNDTPETYGSTGKKFWHIMKLFGIEESNTEQNTRESKYAKWALDNWTEEGDYGNIENPIKAPLKWFDIERSETGSQIEYKTGDAEVLGFDEDDASERADYDFYAWGGEMETNDWGDYESYDSTIDSIDFIRMDEAKRIVKVLREQEGLDAALKHAEQEDFGELMYEVLRRVRQIPLDKTVSPRRIKEILSEDKVVFDLKSGADLHGKIHREYNRVRFYEYSQQLLHTTAKGVRGHYFEGLLAGLFNGEVVTAMEGEMTDPKEDVVINGIPYSAKLVRAQDKKWDSGSLFGGWKQAIIQLLIDKGIDPTDFKNTPFKVKDLTEKFYELIPEGDDDRDTYQFKIMEVFLKDGNVLDKYKEIILKHAFTTKSEEEIGEGLNWIFGLISGTNENFEGEDLPKTNLKYYLIDTPSLIAGILSEKISFSKGRTDKMIRIDEEGMIAANGASPHSIIFPKVSRQDLRDLLYDENSEEMVYKVMGIFKELAPGTEKYMHHKVADVIKDNAPKFIEKLQDLFPKKKITEQTISRIVEDIDPELKYTIDQQYRTNPELRDDIIHSLNKNQQIVSDSYYLNPLDDQLNVPPIKIAQKFSDVNGYGNIKFDMQGGNGIAYFTDKDLVIKLTTDDSEYFTANKLVGTDNEYIVKVIESARINTSHIKGDLFVIVEEALPMTKEMEQIWSECCCGSDSPIMIDYLKQPALVLPPVSDQEKCIPIYDGIMGIRENFAEYEIFWSDIGIDNLGIKNGHLAAIDLGETIGGTIKGNEVTLNLENIKSRPLTKKHIQKQLLKV